MRKGLRCEIVVGLSGTDKSCCVLQGDSKSMHFSNGGSNGYTSGDTVSYRY